MQSSASVWTKVKPLGRTHQIADTLWLAYSGAGAEFVFRGSWCRVTMAGDSVSHDAQNTGNHGRIAIYLDGARVVDSMMDAPEKNWTVAAHQPGEHLVRIVKLSETAMSTCAVQRIETDGTIQPAPVKAHLVEFIGDSITCGYGVDDEDPVHHFVTSTEDVTRAYAYKTAQLLDADYSMASISGYGIISGFTDTAEAPVTSQLMPDYYDKLGFSYGEYKGKKPEQIQWTFDERRPDVIVINLGTNDDSYCRDDPERQRAYCAAYIRFLHAVRAKNPGAMILCTLGMMGDRLYPWVEKAAADYSAATGDQHIACMAFTPQLPEDGLAADYHPTEATHQKAAQRLAERIRQLMHW